MESPLFTIYKQHNHLLTYLLRQPLKIKLFTKILPT